MLHTIIEKWINDSKLQDAYVDPNYDIALQELKARIPELERAIVTYGLTGKTD